MSTAPRTPKAWRDSVTGKSFQAWPEDDGTWEVIRMKIIHVCGGVMELVSVGEPRYLTDHQLARKIR